MPRRRKALSAASSANGDRESGGVEVSVRWRLGKFLVGLHNAIYRINKLLEDTADWNAFRKTLVLIELTRLAYTTCNIEVGRGIGVMKLPKRVDRCLFIKNVLQPEHIAMTDRDKKFVGSKIELYRDRFLGFIPEAVSVSDVMPGVADGAMSDSGDTYAALGQALQQEESAQIRGAAGVEQSPSYGPERVRGRQFLLFEQQRLRGRVSSTEELREKAQELRWPTAEREDGVRGKRARPDGKEAEGEPGQRRARLASAKDLADERQSGDGVSSCPQNPVHP